MKKTLVIRIIVLFIAAGLFFSCEQIADQKTEEPESIISEVVHPDWSKNVVLYEINLRQFTEEGTIIAFEKRENKKKDEFNVLILQGDVETIISKETGKPYLTLYELNRWL